MLPRWPCHYWLISSLAVPVSFFLFLLPRLGAQPEVSGYEIRRISVQDGLESQIITTICADQQGLLWFGTQSGLYSFDGYRVARLKQSGLPLPSEYVTDLVQINTPSQALLWIATQAGSCLLDPVTRQIIPAATLGLPDSLLRRCIQIEKRADGSLLALGKDRLFQLKPTKSGHYSAQDLLPVPQMIAPKLFVDPEIPNVAWVMPVKNRIYSLVQGNLSEIAIRQEGQKPTPVEGILQFIPTGNHGLVGWDHVRNLFYLDQSRKIKANPDSLKTLESFLPGVGAIDRMLKQKPVIRCHTVLEGGQEAYGTSLGLFLVYRKTSLFHVIEPLVEEEIRGILADSSGRWWAGTYTGLYTGSAPGGPVKKTNNFTTVWDFLPVGNDCWLLALERPNGLITWNRTSNQVVSTARVEGLVHSAKMSQTLKLCQDFRGHIWAGTYTGLLHSDPGPAYDFRLFKDPVTGGAFNQAFIRALLHDADSSIWIGAQDGVYRLIFNKRKMRYEPDPKAPYLKNSVIIDFYQDRTSNIWIATRDSGIFCRQKSTGIFRRYDMENGLSNNATCRIESSHNDQVLWISTHNGLSRLHVPSGIFHNFYEESGFPGHEFNAAASTTFPNGTMLFGGVNGLVSFHPDSIFITNYHYKTIVSGAQVYDNDTKTLKDLTLQDRRIHLGPYPQYLVFYWALQSISGQRR